MQLVTAYYLIPSKQPHAFYMENIKRFFKFVTIPVLFFTSRDMFKKLAPFAGKNVIFRVVEFKQLEVLTEFPQSFWEKQIQRDVESYHTWQLGAIWANKKYFIKEATKEFPDKDWFVWIDAGSIRKESWKPFIEKFTTRESELREPSVYVQVLDAIPKEKSFFRYPDQHVAGALILAHRSCIHDYINDYNTILKEYDSLSIAGTMDQYIMASVINRFPRWVGVERGKVLTFAYINSCPDPWFFFLALL
jgi:hypothetical protein